MSINKITENKKQEYYLLVDYISYGGGVNNYQRAKLVPVGMAWGFLKCFTSRIDKAESYAKSYAKSNNLLLV